MRVRLNRVGDAFDLHPLPGGRGHGRGRPIPVVCRTSRAAWRTAELDGFDPRSTPASTSPSPRTARLTSTARPRRSVRGPTRRSTSTISPRTTRASGSSSSTGWRSCCLTGRSGTRRPGDHVRRAAGLCGRLAELLPGCSGNRSVPGHSEAAHLGAPARAAGRLPDARRMQRGGRGWPSIASRRFTSSTGRRRSSLPGRKRPNWRRARCLDARDSHGCAARTRYLSLSTAVRSPCAPATMRFASIPGTGRRPACLRARPTTSSTATYLRPRTGKGPRTTRSKAGRGGCIQARAGKTCRNP